MKELEKKTGSLKSKTKVGKLGPADWYKYQSNVDSTKYICVQSDPGSGWTQVGGPYQKSNCT
jgi:hypothetical protein